MNNQWIPIKERLPREDERVLVAVAGGAVGIVTRIGNYFLYDGSGAEAEIAKTRITHWQPLPEPPPKPDAFEQWWDKQEKSNDQHLRCVNGCLILKKTARALWESMEQAKEGK